MKIIANGIPAWVGVYTCAVCQTEFETDGTDYDAQPGTMYFNSKLGSRPVVGRAVKTEAFITGDNVRMTQAVGFDVRCPGCGYVNEGVMPKPKTGQK